MVFLLTDASVQVGPRAVGLAGDVHGLETSGIEDKGWITGVSGLFEEKKDWSQFLDQILERPGCTPSILALLAENVGL